MRPDTVPACWRSLSPPESAGRWPEPGPAAEQPNEPLSAKAALPDRASVGPFDETEANPVRPYIDLGGIKILPREGLNLRLEVEAAAFSERVGQTYASEDLLPRMARALGEGTSSARADVWVRVGQSLRPEAIWPEDAEPLSPRPVSSIDEGAVMGASMFE